MKFFASSSYEKAIFSSRIESSIINNRPVVVIVVVVVMVVVVVVNVIVIILTTYSKVLFSWYINFIFYRWGRVPFIASGGVKTVVHAAADLQDKDHEEGQPAHIQASRRTQANAPPLLIAGVPPQTSSSSWTAGPRAWDEQDSRGVYKLGGSDDLHDGTQRQRRPKWRKHAGQRYRKCRA